MIPISKLKLNPTNPRIIKDDKFKKLVQSLKDFPEMMEKRPMVCVTDEDGKLYPLGGNMRLRAIKEMGFKEVPETWVTLADEWTEEQRREFIVKDNVGFGEWNWDELQENWDSEKLVSWGLEVPEWESEKLEAVEDYYDAELPEEPKTVLGDLYEIGEHRLLCGDSTDSDQVAKLMNGEKADMVFTDPPYEIDLDYENIVLFSENCHVFIFNNDRAIIRQLSKSPLYFKKFFVFYHPGTAIPQEGGNEIFLDHVLVSHEINGNPKVRYNKGNGTRSVIKGKYRHSIKHKHEKPISFLSPIIEGYSNEKFIILDLFAGGGSMFSASHQLNRKCYGMELDPKYCDVIVKRMISLDTELSVKRNGIDVTDSFKLK
jgi:16S rRNA G966 N2-methylase RsmD